MDKLTQGDVPDMTDAALQAAMRKGEFGRAKEAADEPAPSPAAAEAAPAEAPAEPSEDPPSPKPKPRGLRRLMPNLLGIDEVASGLGERKFFRPSERDAEEEYLANAPETDDHLQQELKKVTDGFFANLQSNQKREPAVPATKLFDLEKALEGIDLDSILADAESGKLTPDMLRTAKKPELNTGSLADMMQSMQQLTASMKARGGDADTAEIPDAPVTKPQPAASSTPMAPPKTAPAAPPPKPEAEPEAKPEKVFEAVPQPKTTMTREEAERDRERKGRWTVIEYEDDDDDDEDN
uniref:Uncharacterized protein n=1 Tax=Eutreptiella gymnastica TaxID=73025 RepID=A0A7S4GF90_9EUGL